MVILSIALALTLGGIGVLIAVVLNLRARIRAQEAQLRKTPNAAPSLIVEYSDDMELPAPLIGARCKEIIEKFAPTVGLTPVNLLRAAIAEGLTGGRPVLQETLDILEEIRREEAEAMRLGLMSERDGEPPKPD